MTPERFREIITGVQEQASPEEIATELKVTPPTVLRWLSGKSSPSTPVVRRTMARQLDDMFGLA